jgi:hypothetical protein
MRPIHIVLKIAELKELIARAQVHVKQLEREYPTGPENSREEVSPSRWSGASFLDCRSTRVAPALTT